MTIELLVLLVATCLAGAVGMLIVVRSRRRGGVLWKPLGWVSLLLVDWWLWQAAFATAFGPQHWLVGPLTLVNAIAAFGGIYSLTGFRPHNDVTGGGGGRMGTFLGRDASMRANGFRDDPYR